MDRYVESWSQEGALTAMLNYYRCSVRPPKGTKPTIRPITAPTLMIWGEADRYLGPGVRDVDPADVPNLERVEEIPDASHWVHHDAPERVTQLLLDFFSPARAAVASGDRQQGGS
jgi:pimeloyl-ACP methyl ester carboxylesterase